MKTCFHCDSLCEEEILLDDKTFCCVGCSTVYDILHLNGLDTYYSLNAKPGSKTISFDSGKYDFLNLKEISDQLLLFEEGDMAKIRLNLPQIHCSSCLWLLEQLYIINPGIKQSQVNFIDKQAEITFNKTEIGLKELVELLDKIGYPPLLSLQEEDKAKDRKVRNRVVIQIGIVGFCFGNIMLLSFPEYLGLDESFSAFQDTFNWLNLLLSIPILVFGAKGYIVSAYKSLRAKKMNIDVPITLGIFALYGQSLFEVLSETGAGYFDSFAGLIFFLLIGKWFQQRTYNAINFERDYKSYFPIATTKKEGSSYISIPLEKVKVGDVLVIKNNELVPSDAVLLSGEARIDYSFVTGEAAPVKKIPGDKLFAGGKQKGSALEVEVIKEVENSYLTRLWNNPVFTQKKQTKSLSDAISKYFTLTIIGLAAVAGLIWYQIEPSKTAFIITSILIVACPCAIALSIPFTYGNGMRALSNQLLFLRSADVIESMTGVTDLVFDKTGTLTKSDELAIKWVGSELSDNQKLGISTLAFQSNHPLSRRIAGHLNLGGPNLDISDFVEHPSNGIEGKVGKDLFRLGKGDWLGNEVDSNKTKVHVTMNNEHLGFFEFGNVYRSGISDMMSKLQSKYQIHVLSGDNDSERDYFESLSSKIRVKFNQSPGDKLDYIAEIQSRGSKVLMLGDGLNDAGAIKQSDVGIAVVEDVYAFSPSSDGILNGAKLSSLADFMEFAIYCKNVVWTSYVFALIYNMTGLYFALSGQLTPLIAAILMPLSSISSVLLVTLLVNIKSKKIIQNQ